MIPRPAIVQWARNVPWPTEEQIEQDLLLSRLIVEIANDPYLGDELNFRGGTCLHKLHMPRPLRYSEDLDYVRRTAGGIADLTRAATRLGESLWMDVRTRIGEQPKILFRAPFESGSPAEASVALVRSTSSSLYSWSLYCGAGDCESWPRSSSLTLPPSMAPGAFVERHPLEEFLAFRWQAA